MTSYENLAIQYAEKYGVVDYKVKGNVMIFNVSYPAYLHEKAYTVQHMINLDTGVETMKKLSRLDRSGFNNCR